MPLGAPGGAGTVPRGRPRDPAKDSAISDATLALLIRDGFDRTSIESIAVAARVSKATIYRRWTSKAELAADAIANLETPVFSDTGTLEGDVSAMVATWCVPDSLKLLQVVASICSVLPREPELFEALRTRIVEPRISHVVEMLDRSRKRGEIGPKVDVRMAASLLPTLLVQRTLLTGHPPTRAYVEHLVDSVLLPVITNRLGQLSDRDVR